MTGTDNTKTASCDVTTYSLSELYRRFEIIRHLCYTNCDLMFFLYLV
jgi:hypothetical protein